MQGDIQIRTDVLDALAFDPSLDASRIGVAVENGIVTLSGEVRSYPERWTAERVTKRVAGVRGIAEEIAVNLPEHHERSDIDIAEAALQALRCPRIGPSKQQSQREPQHGQQHQRPHHPDGNAEGRHQ